MKGKVTDESFKEEVLESGLPVLVDFWAPWCAPCSIVAPIVEELARDYEGKLKVCKLNVDEEPNTASQYGIMSIPTLMLFKKGEVLDQIVGAVEKKVLEEKIRQYI